MFQNGALPFNKFEFLVMWLFREVSAPYIMIHSVCNPSIRWRNFRYRLQWGGVAIVETIKPIPPPANNDCSNSMEKAPSEIDIKCKELEYSCGKSGYYSSSSGGVTSIDMYHSNRVNTNGHSDVSSYIHDKLALLKE